MHNYTMHGQILGRLDQNPYLGVEFTNKLRWDIHINNIVSKANRSLGFLRRNISKFPENIKKMAYLALVRPNLEYASSAWDPYQANHISKIEMVQRRSARFIKHQYSREPGSVTQLMKTWNYQHYRQEEKSKDYACFIKRTIRKLRSTYHRTLRRKQQLQDNTIQNDTGTCEQIVILISSVSSREPSGSGTICHRNYWTLMTLRHSRPTSHH